MSTPSNIISGGDDIRTSGVRAKKIEPDVDVPLNIDQTQSIDLVYNIDSLKDTAQIERVAGDCIEIEYPVTDVSEFCYLPLIESQFADQNAADMDDESIDKSICQLIPYYLDQEGVQLPDDKKDAARVKTLMLKQVKGLKSDEKIIDYLKDKEYLTHLFGSVANSIDVSASTYSAVRDQYEIDRRPVRNAICRLRHMLYRNGVPLEQPPTAGYNRGQAIPMGMKLSDQLRSRALINWCDLLLDQLTAGISFNRSGSIYSIREIIAAIANITIAKNTRRRQRLGRLKYHDNIITTGQIHNIINRNITKDNFLRSKQELEHIATELHRNLFKFAADELGFFSDSLDIAIDPTSISLEEYMEYEQVPGAMGDIQVEGDSAFKFATGVSYSPMSRFSMGVSLVTDKSELTNIYRRMMLVLEEFTNIGWILADREFDHPEAIELARTKAVDTWIIRLRKHHNLIDKKEYRKLKENGKATLSFGNLDINAYWTDISNSDFSWVFQSEEQDDELILMSGQPLNETNISQLNKIYPKRWSAESHIRQLKNEFLPKMPGEYAFDYLFFLNIASIFYNIHKIICQSVSPMYGLPLQPTYYEILWGIVNSTFQCRCCRE
jgi:hypothetical protein